MIPVMRFLVVATLFVTVVAAPVVWGEPVPNSDVLKKICSSSCSGFGAGIKVLADKGGKVKYYRFDGSIRDCSHPPSVLYDLKGNEVAAMGSNPVDPKNQAQAKAIQKWQRLLEGLTESKTIWCDAVQ